MSINFHTNTKLGLLDMYDDINEFSNTLTYIVSFIITVVFVLILIVIVMCLDDQKENTFSHTELKPTTLRIERKKYLPNKLFEVFSDYVIIKKTNNDFKIKNGLIKIKNSDYIISAKLVDYKINTKNNNYIFENHNADILNDLIYNIKDNILTLHTKNNTITFKLIKIKIKKYKHKTLEELIENKLLKLKI